jgi:hypothetical protein
MYEASMTLTDLPPGDSTAPTSALVLVPGVVGNNIYRRKVVGSTSNGLPITMDIRGDVLAPSGARKYSVFRLTVTVNETSSQDAIWGPPPVTATTVSINVPFGAVEEASLTFATLCERVRIHLGWELQYLSGQQFTTTAASGEAALLTDIIPVADFALALANLADGIR